eukprot:CAMPEP_0176502874 /NCGR_PEP_ID=MMETSP0200_2-20121128/15017_1 /TAXON_ID=947934 /ORGANISM="Chaetoceros sp., Strain GSL56" /LENGTH=545 /DNA_ID=CAMNT_0017902037 /DNA_START=156 /DNA_END=1793 /DNA_ORIENTATION=+
MNKNNENTREEIKLVKEYLRKCSCVPSSSLAIHAAIRALDEELQKLDRDEKLRLKFSQGQQGGGGEENRKEIRNADTYGGQKATTEDNNTMDTQRMNDAKDNDSELQDWQNIGPQYADSNTNNNDHDKYGNEYHVGESFGAKLVKAAFVEMSQAGTKVSTPTAALALILHSALVSPLLGFKCTGIPDDIWCFQTDKIDDDSQRRQGSEQKKLKGFAPPIRELPRGVFVPDNWDSHAIESHQLPHYVLLRYSKIDMPVTVLRVETRNTSTMEMMVSLKFGPLGGEPCDFVFPIHQHINVDGLESALIHKQSPVSGVSPSLHYKALVKLLTDFCNVADLGVVNDDSSGKNMESDRIAEYYTRNSIPPILSKTEEQQLQQWQRQQEQQQREARRTSVDPSPVGGDFPDDLIPSGIPLPGFADPHPLRIGGNNSDDGGRIGNLMGPNHPMFRPPHFGRDNDNDDEYGQGGNDFILPGGLGMQPRFDPYYPPGVVGGGTGRFPYPGRYGRGRGGRGRGGGRFYGGGDPDPDHQRPPNTFGNGNGDGSMFM